MCRCFIIFWLVKQNYQPPCELPSQNCAFAFIAGNNIYVILCVPQTFIRLLILTFSTRSFNNKRDYSIETYRVLNVFHERTRETCFACWILRPPRHSALTSIPPATDIASGQSVHTLTNDSRHSRATPSRYSWRCAGAYSRRLALRSLALPSGAYRPFKHVEGVKRDVRKDGKYKHTRRMRLI